MVDCKLAKCLKKSVSKNGKSNTVKLDKQFREKCDIEITHPQWIFFRDKTGCNTKMQHNRNYSSTKYIVPVNLTLQKQIVCTNHCFMLFSLVTATGKLVVNIIIFNSAAKAVKAS